MKNNDGFNLIEILITLAIIGTLSTFALPIYNNYVLETNRLEATAGLFELALALEEYYILHLSYQFATLQNLQFKNHSQHYQFKIQATDQNYLLIAEPIGKQAHDKECAAFILHVSGDKRITGKGEVEDCWRAN